MNDANYTAATCHQIDCKSGLLTEGKEMLVPFPLLVRSSLLCSVEYTVTLSVHIHVVLLKQLYKFGQI